MLPMTIWVLTGVSCVLLLLSGNSKVNAEGDRTQPEQESPTSRRKPPPDGKPPSFPLSFNTYPYPIVNKNNVAYYDLAGLKDMDIKLLSNVQNVTGITASQGECRNLSLYLGFSYMLDEDLINNCPQIKLELKEGKKWRCLQDGLMLYERGVKVDMREALCSDVWHENATEVKQKDKVHKYKMTEGIQKLLEFNITNCPAKRCQCKWYFKGENYTVFVDCEDSGLTDDTLPTLPDKTIDIRMERNNLRSIDKLIQHVLPHHQILRVLRVDYNLLDHLPHLPNGTFPHLVDLSLVSNKIEKIDIEAFRELVTRKDLVIQLSGNTFPCDCVLYNFKVFLEENYLRHWDAFKSFMDMECKYEGENKTAKMHTLSEDLCKTWLDGWQTKYWWYVLNGTLGILNLFVILLMVDLICVVKHVGPEHVPFMDRFVRWRRRRELPSAGSKRDSEMDDFRPRVRLTKY